jgi:hypothetical protein
VRGFEFYYDNNEGEIRIPLYDKIEFTRARPIKKSRIDTQCEFCYNTITKGQSCQYWSGISQGKFFYYRVCNNCLN